MDDETTRRVRDVAEWWTQTLEYRPGTDGRFDSTVSVRAPRRVEYSEDELAEVLRRLPRLQFEPESERIADLEYGDVLGTGGRGVVRLARQLPVRRDVAVKHIRRSDDESRDLALYGLLREAWVTGHLEHPNIVPIHRVGRTADGEPLIVMKHIEGVSWREVLDDPASALSDRFETGHPLQRHIDILIDLCEAVEFAHARNIIHRDLKPSNVMLGEYGEVYLFDWGLAVALERIDENPQIPTIDEVERSVGTPSYMAPEAIVPRAGEIDERTDIYQLGAILFRLLKGRPPHIGETTVECLRSVAESRAPEFDSDVPDRLASICSRALSPVKRHRYQSVAEFRRELRNYKTQRESIAISDEAHRRLHALEERLDGLGRARSTGTEGLEDEREIWQEFATCRFGFEQALELNEDNEEAREGLQRLLEEMIELQLDNEAYESAVHLLSDLPEPHERLEERAEQLRERLDSRQQEYEKLREFREELDVEVGRSARSKFVLAVGFWTVLLNLTPLVWESATGTGAGVVLPLTAYAVYAGGLAGLVHWFRDALLPNDANRKMFVTFLAILGADGLFRLLGLLASAPQPVTAAHKAVMVGMSFVALAVALDLRLLWLAGTFLCTAPLQLVFPGLFLEIAAGGVVVGTSLLAWAWWPRSE